MTLTLNAGSGGSDLATDVVSLEHYQMIKAGLGAAGAFTLLDGNSGNKSAGTLRVVLATDQPALTNKLLVTPDLPTGASTAAKQPALGTAGTASADVITVQGIASMTALKVDGSGVTQPVSGTVTANMGTVTADPFGANADAASATGSISAKLRFIAGTGIPITSLPTLAAVTTVSTVTSLTQFNGNAIALNTGTRSAGTLRVTIATDDVVPASQSGTWTVQPGNTANTTAWLVSEVPRTSGGLLVANMTSGDTFTALTNTAQAIKASAGQLYGWYIYNPNSSAAVVNIYNIAAASVTVGTSTPKMNLTIPATSAANILGENGIEFTNAGWSASATTTAGGSTAPSTALEAQFFYI